MSEKAVAYRQANNISADHYTAVSIVTMKFGNRNINSGSGVFFTRNPTTGENSPYGEYLPGGQGDQVVDGVVTPMSLDTFAAQNKNLMVELLEHGENCEDRFRDMQEIEFTVEDGKLWILQSRDGKRESAANIRITYDMLYAEKIDESTALNRVAIQDFFNLNMSKVAENAPSHKYEGLPASSGIVEGKAVLDSESAKKWGAQEPVILVRPMTETDDLPGMLMSVGILTETGGLTCHAAVVARDMNVPAVVGAGDLTQIKEGDHLFIDGNTGRVWVNTVPELVEGKWDEWAEKLYHWFKADMSVIERVSFDPANPVLPTDGGLHIDTHLVKTSVEMGSLLNVMAKRPGFYILNLETPKYEGSADDLIWKSFGTSDGPSGETNIIDEKVFALAEFEADPDYPLHHRVHIKTTERVTELTEADWKVMETMDDLVSIAKSKADVLIFAPELMQVLGAETEKWKQFCEKAGKIIYEDVPAKYRNEILVDIFKDQL
jgi:phosphohistidine swiveling domain-containing protein